MGCTIERWTAQATGSGEERVITVRGEGECTQGGYQLRLELTNEGPIDDPEWAAVRLFVEEPENGTDLMTPVQVELKIEGDPATKVRIDMPEGSENVDIKEAS